VKLSFISSGPVGEKKTTGEYLRYHSTPLTGFQSFCPANDVAQHLISQFWKTADLGDRKSRNQKIGFQKGEVIRPRHSPRTVEGGAQTTIMLLPLTDKKYRSQG
jgi:hypothetical protein